MNFSAKEKYADDRPEPDGGDGSRHETVHLQVDDEGICPPSSISNCEKLIIKSSPVSQTTIALQELKDGAITSHSTYHAARHVHHGTENAVRS